jgi:hypothetical protein
MVPASTSEFQILLLVALAGGINMGVRVLYPGSCGSGSDAYHQGQE